MEKRPNKKSFDKLKSQLILDLMDETTPTYRIHLLSNEYMAQLSKFKMKKNGRK